MAEQARQCESCSLCCKLLNTEEMESPAGSWCRECTPGRANGACQIFNSTEDRPQTCNNFQCLWLAGGMGKGDSFRPDKVKGVVVATTDPVQHLILYVDRLNQGVYKKGRLGRFVHRASMGLPVVVICEGKVKTICATGRKAQTAAARLLETVRKEKA